MSEGVIRCPAIRSLVTNDQLTHSDLVAKVEDVVRVLSGGKDRELSWNEPGSLANVAGFFAIHNHSIGTPKGGSLRQRLRGLLAKLSRIDDAVSVSKGNETDRDFSLCFFQSDGDHPGTVDFFKDDAGGTFDETHFDRTMARFAPGGRLAIDGIAAMIIQANGADPEATEVDLGKSAGEWALMVSALGPEIVVSELKAMYQGDSTKLLAGTAVATASAWLATTIRISEAIAAQTDRTTIAKLARKLHEAFGDDFNDGDEKLCPCKDCNRQQWVAEDARAVSDHPRDAAQARPSPGHADPRRHDGAES